jgi:hypothetical protein
MQQQWLSAGAGVVEEGHDAFGKVLGEMLIVRCVLFTLLIFVSN